MTLHADNPVQELLASGLHRLAQPISSAMWSVELAKEPTVEPLPHLASEMRRAAGILHVMRSVIEAGNSYLDTEPQSINRLLTELHQQMDPDLEKRGLQCQPVEAPSQIFASVDARGFAAAYRMLLEKLLSLDLAPAAIRESLTPLGESFVLALECDSPRIAAWPEATRTHLFLELDPFEIPGFDFSSHIAPQITQARAILGSSGLVLTGTLHASVMSFQMHGLQSSH